MNMVECIRWVNCAIGGDRRPRVHRTGKTLASAYFKICGHAHITLCSGIEAKVSPNFRHIKNYEPEAMHTVSRLLKPGDTAIDVGAHIGLYTLLMGRRVGQTGKVYAFEPTSQSFATVVKHVKLNRLMDIIEVHRLLAGDKTGTELFFEDGINGTNRVGGSRFDGLGTIVAERQTITLDDFLCSKGRLPNLIKIDVEGYELRVMLGLEKTIEASRCRIVCEMHPDLWQPLGHSWVEMQDLLDRVGYGIFDLSGNSLAAVPLSERSIFILQSAQP
jgi:FkbM family methyltransferase